jgi:hypothetical protein
MAPKLYKHFCLICGHSYLAYDKEKIFCSTDCEAKKAWEDKHPKAAKVRMEKRREEDNIKPKEQVDEIQRFLNKKLPPKPKPKQSFNHSLYKGTFSPWIPKGLRVMRG